MLNIELLDDQKSLSPDWLWTHDMAERGFDIRQLQFAHQPSARAAYFSCTLALNADGGVYLVSVPENGGEVVEVVRFFPKMLRSSKCLLASDEA